MTHVTGPLTPIRRRAVDRLLIHYLELPESDQAAWLAGSRERLPRLTSWLERLIENSHTVTLLDDSVRSLAERSVRAMEAETEELSMGARLGPWEVLEEAGQGGMGRVYRGRRADGAFEMDVAIKLIGQRRAGLAELLQRECRLLARLDHPCVTRLLDAGLDERAGPFLVMEWVEGTDLKDWLAERNPDLKQRLRIFEQIVESVSHAHQRLIVHGDIKPGNVRLRDDGTVKLMDFGVAQLIGNHNSDSALKALTPSFAAPEQLNGEEVTPGSDIWSLGALMHWLLTGDVMRLEQADSPVIQQHERGRELAKIIDKACAKLPEHRYRTASELARDLLHFRTRHPVSAMPPDRVYRLNCFLRRNLILAGGITATILALGIGMATTTVMYMQADQARQNALHERDRAERHARELEWVAAFQETQLADIDTTMMGAGIRSRLIDQHQMSLASLPLSPEKGQARTRAFSEELALVNFTDLALSTLDTELFERSQAAIDEQFEDQHEVRARLLQALATTQRDVGLLNEALDPQRLALEIRTNTLGRDHPATLDSIVQLGALKYAMSNPEDALPLFQEGHSLRSEILGEHHPKTLEALHAIGSASSQVGKLEAAERLYRAALAAQKQQLGEDHPDTIMSLISLGAVLRFTGQTEEAWDTLSRAKELSIDVLGSTHEHSLIALSQLATAAGEQGQFDLSERYFRELLEMQYEKFGSHHHQTLATKRILGTVLQRIGNLDEARIYMSRALEGRRALFGNTNTRTERAISFMARLLYDLNEYEEAEEHYAELLELKRINRGKDHFLTLRAMLNLAHTRRALNQIDAALDLTTQALSMAKSALPEGDDLTARLSLLHEQLEEVPHRTKDEI